jgi:cytochrome c1
MLLVCAHGRSRHLKRLDYNEPTMVEKPRVHAADLRGVSRLTIAGASLAQNRGNLAGWVVDPQHVKPGNLMPNMDLNSQDLQALLAYLATLK